MALDLADADLDGGTAAVAGKGHTEPVRMTLPGPTRAALAGWAASRGGEPGPQFVRLDRAARGPTRLTATAVFLIVRDLGRSVGLSRPTRPHGLRHEAITRALDATGGTCGRCSGSPATPTPGRCWCTTTAAGTRPGTSPGWWPGSETEDVLPRHPGTES